jgi:hypothetical protein
MDLLKINMKDSEPACLDCQLVSAKLDWTEVSKEGYYDQIGLINRKGVESSTELLG